MRIISMQPGDDVIAVFKRLSTAIGEIEAALGAHGYHFQFNGHLGFIHGCPTNCGTGMRASVHVRLPLLSKTAGFKELCDSLRVQARGEHGEHSDDSSGVYDISNKERLGKTEVQLVQTMIDGVRTLIEKEQKLEVAAADA